MYNGKVTLSSYLFVIFSEAAQPRRGRLAKARGGWLAGPVARILVVEDEPQMVELLARGLRDEGYEVVTATDGTAGLIEATADRFTAAVVDVMLPGLDGFEFCRQLRLRDSHLPVLLLTARDAVEDRVHGLDSGADDYLVKPFAWPELSARVRALVRRDALEQKVIVTVGALELDSATLRARVAGAPVALSAREFALARLFATHPGETLERSHILREVWGTSTHIDPNVLDQYVRYLRRKLDPERVGFTISTVRGIGYRLEEQQERGT
jgi:two-component system OmpR family response regulator